MVIALVIVAALAIGCALWAFSLKNANVRLDAECRQTRGELQRVTSEAADAVKRQNDEFQARLDREARMREESERLRREEAETHERLRKEEAAERERTFQEAIQAQFKAMAAEAFAAQATSMRQAQENGLGLILKPLREELDSFRKAVNDTYSAETRQHISLQEHIKLLVETNRTIGREARELSRALKGDSKVQGDWGEMVLESILEKTGLVEGEHYHVQPTQDAEGNPYENESGARLRPDVVLHYPSRGDLVIDSKVSLKSYIDYVNAGEDTGREAALALHVKSVRSHVRELRDKRYQDNINRKTGQRTMEFAMMFIPNEGAYLAAMHSDPGLWQEALESHVIIVSPTHLVCVLSMIEQVWDENRRDRNATEIAEAAGRMYEKFVGFMADMEKIKKAIDGADKAYGDAMNKLREGKGNLIKRAEDIRELGAKTRKQLSK